jgi:hypothetical protein
MNVNGGVHVLAEGALAIVKREINLICLDKTPAKGIVNPTRGIISDEPIRL